jgi:antitoxin (DNA-binding transcriptional repressor) of toxin-antitoxin stability system
MPSPTPGELPIIQATMDLIQWFVPPDHQLLHPAELAQYRALIASTTPDRRRSQRPCGIKHLVRTTGRPDVRDPSQRLQRETLGCVHTSRGEAMGARVGIRELRARLASHLESATPIEVTRHGRTIGFYVPLPEQVDLNDRERLLEAGRLMQAELQRLGLTEDELAADFQQWRQQRHSP